jgi:hypothetical protein
LVARVLVATALIATDASALTGEIDAQPSGYELTTPKGSGGGAVESDVLLAPQRRGFGGDALSLTSEQDLIGRFGLTAKDVLEELAPHLAEARLVLERASGSGAVVHEYYGLVLGDLPVAGAWLHLHHHANRLSLVRARLPAYRLPPELPGAADFLPLASLGHEFDEGVESVTTRRVIAESGGLPAAAWEVTRTEKRSGRTLLQVIDAQTGAVLSTRTQSFDLAEVYAVNPGQGDVVSVELPDLPGTGYLDGRYFTVYAPTAADPRVQAPDGTFVFRADDPGDALAFDQVQAYYSATRALAWFRARFGWDPGEVHIDLRVNVDFGGTLDDARYVPPPVGPEIQIGAGSRLVNLARDTDVTSHEFAHHVIWETLRSTDGESAVVHEGTADYFAYAINGDPRLAESVVPGKPYLRTAELPADRRWEDLDDKAGAHVKGELWSATLWRLRLHLGAKADQLVYDSLAYLGPESGIRDALIALLNADRDGSPAPAREASEVGAGVIPFGEHKCAILEAAVQRGFATFVEDVDGSDCGLDLVQLAADSRARLAGRTEEGQGQSMKVTAFGRTCAAVPTSSGATSPAAAAVFLALLLALPLLAGALSAHATGRSKVKIRPEVPHGH